MFDPARALRALYAESKRRRVLRVAAAYAVIGFVVIQVADLLVPALLLPEWVFRAVVLVGLLAFPVVLVVAWAFDLTPEGLRRTPALDEDGDERTPAAMPTRLGAALAAALLVGVGAAAWHLWLDPGAAGPASEGLDAWEGGEPTPGTAEGSGSVAPVIAVLPFDNLSGSEENRYFSDGMTEDILTQLSKIRGLTVISRQSVMQYGDSDKSMGEIAEELAASHVVEGSVRRAGSTVRVTAQLIDARTDRHVWAEQYDRAYSVEGVFDIQTEIAGQIARALQGTLAATAQDRMTDLPTHDLTAYDYLLRGRELAERGTREDIERAIAFARQAIALDPEYAQAHAALAGGFTALVGATGAAPHWMDSAEVAANQALELAPEAPEAHSTLALVYWNSGRKTAAIDTYRRVLELSPNHPSALWGLAFALWLRGDLAEALDFARRARTVNPAGANAGALLGRCYAALRLFENAEREFRRVLRIQPDNPWAHEDLLWTYIARGDRTAAAEQLHTLGALLPESLEFLSNAGALALLEGDYEEARRRFERVVELYPEQKARMQVALGHVHLRLGEEDRGREILLDAASSWEDARRSAGEDYGPSLHLAQIQAGLGRIDESLRSLEGAYERGWRGWPFIDVGLDPYLAELRDDPRFQELRSRILTDVEEARLDVPSDAGGP